VTDDGLCYSREGLEKERRRGRRLCEGGEGKERGRYQSGGGVSNF